MSINFANLKTLLKSTGYSVYQDKAPKGTFYPYLVCSYMSEPHKRASSKILRKMPQYQISLYTLGLAKDFDPITKILDSNGIAFSAIDSIQGDENDDSVTNFFIRVRCISDV